MYLSGDAVHDMFRQCAAITSPGSRVAFSYIPSGADGRPDIGRWTGLMLWLQKMVKEPWLWSIRPEDLGAFLSDTGWTIAPDLTGSSEKRGVEFYIAAVRAATMAQ